MAEDPTKASPPAGAGAGATPHTASGTEAVESHTAAAASTGEEPVEAPAPAYEDATREKDPGQEHVAHIEDTGVTRDKHRQAGESFIRQQHTIPTTGKRMLTSKWEYIFFCMFCKSTPSTLYRHFTLLTMFV